MIRGICLLLSMVFVACAFSSCADATAKQNDPDQVSSIPWNRPEKWENGSNIPGGDMMGTR